MSNMLPQKPRLNRDVWENLEREEVKEYAQKFGEVWIITGGFFDGDVKRLKSGVEIPDECWKILVDENGNKVRVLAFLIPQTVTGKEDFRVFQTTVDDIEAKTGLDFLSDLPDDVEADVEGRKGMMW